MRGGRAEERRGGGRGKSGSGRRPQDDSGRPHSRGKVSKRTSSKRSRAVAPHSAGSKSSDFLLKKGRCGKKGKRTTKPPQHNHHHYWGSAASQQPSRSKEATTPADGKVQRDMKKFQVSFCPSKPKENLRRGGSSFRPEDRPRSAAAQDAASAPLRGRKQQQKQSRHPRQTKKKRQHLLKKWKRPAEAKASAREAGLPTAENNQGKRVFSADCAAAAKAFTASAGLETPDGKLSLSKKRKLEAASRLSSRNEDAAYIKQCFRLYGQLLAAPRNAASENEVAGPLADGGQEPKRCSSKGKSCSGSRRSPAVQKAAAALYDFVFPRLKESDRHLCTSRSAQMLLKYGSDAQRKCLWQLLKDQFLNLCMGRSSCQLAMKLYLYGDSQCQQEIMQLLSAPKQGKPVFFSKFGARVWEYVYTAAKNEKQQARMLRSILLPPLAAVRHPDEAAVLSFPRLYEKLDAEAKQVTLDHLRTVIQSCVDKELLDKAPVHKILQHYTAIASPQQLEELMNITGEGFLRLASTKNGVEAMTVLTGSATAKQRKHLIKEMKKHVLSMAKNAIDCVFVLRLLCTVDDTRLLKEGILQPLLANFEELVVDPYGQLILLQLLEDSAEFSRCLPPWYKRLLELPSPTSLKPVPIRMSELRETVLEGLQAAVLKLAGDLSETNVIRDSHIGTSSEEESDQRRRATQQRLKQSGKSGFTLTDWLSDPKAARVLTRLFYYSTRDSVFSAIVDYFSKNQSATLKYFDHPQVQRFFSGLARQMEAYSTQSSLPQDKRAAVDVHAEKRQACESFVRNMWLRVLKPQLASILPTRGVFIVNDILEAARRLILFDIENDIVRSLNSNVLTDAEAYTRNRGTSSIGLEILASKLSLKTTDAQMERLDTEEAHYN